MARRKKKMSDFEAVVVAIIAFMAVLWAMDRKWFDAVAGEARTIVIVAAGGATALIIGIAAYRYLKSIAKAADGAATGRGRASFAAAEAIPPGPAPDMALGAAHSEVRSVLDRDPAMDRAQASGGFSGVRPHPAPRPTATSGVRTAHLSSPAMGEAPDAWSEPLLRALEWKRFELLCTGYWQAKGYRAETTAIGADGGIDIVLRAPGSDDSAKVLGVVQCKAWATRRVGVKPVRELYGVQMDRGAPLAVFMASGEYTDDARAFAEGKDVELITGGKLLTLLENLPETSSRGLLRTVTAGDYTTPTCPHCDVKMVIRTARKAPFTGHQFWGCPNYPRCHQRFWIRKSAR
ncbi:MAG TPA: restriction endonuclease [Gammaproteobacteria bacterium]|nr:restriction endonuclease [Gammaproteobacteria bacterium]